jgi:hypothetical protein
MALSRGASRIGLRFSAGALTILTLTGATSVGVPGFVWMGQVTEGKAVRLWREDSPEDVLFWIECKRKRPR